MCRIFSACICQRKKTSQPVDQLSSKHEPDTKKMPTPRRPAAVGGLDVYRLPSAPRRAVLRAAVVVVAILLSTIVNNNSSHHVLAAGDDAIEGARERERSASFPPYHLFFLSCMYCMYSGMFVLCVFVLEEQRIRKSSCNDRIVSLVLAQ